MKVSDKLKQYMYYIVIGVVSFVALIFLPFLGSDLGMDWNIPNTTVGWIVWVTTRVIISVLNVLIFHSFIQQGIMNVKNDPNYKEAITILGQNKEKDFVPRSPKQWKAQTYGKKGTTILISSLLATVALTQAVLSYDWATALSYLFTIILGLIFGVMQMKSTEEYYTDEILRYAKRVEEENVNSRRQSIQEPAGAGIAEPVGAGTLETSGCECGSGNQDNECGESV